MIERTYCLGLWRLDPRRGPGVFHRRTADGVFTPLTLSHLGHRNPTREELADPRLARVERVFRLWADEGLSAPPRVDDEVEAPEVPGASPAQWLRWVLLPGVEAHLFGTSWSLPARRKIGR